MTRAAVSTLIAAMILPLALGCGKGDAGEGALTVYSGRGKAMVQKIFDAFTEETGIRVNVRYGDTTSLANTIVEEGRAAPADLFFGQDAGALGALAARGLLAPLPESVLDAVDPRFRARDGAWVGVSGRARVIAYNTERVRPEELPADLDGFADPRWRGRVGWLPTNASFQAFVTALRKTRGDDAAEAWLRAIHANAPRTYASNSAAVKAVAAGEVDVAFTNHYYLHRLGLEAGPAGLPVANHYPAGDVGSMMNVAGIGVLASSRRQEAAARLVAFLLTEASQRTFAEDNFEYPLARGVAAAERVTPLADLRLPDVELGELRDLEATLGLLRKAGVLP